MASKKKPGTKKRRANTELHRAASDEPQELRLWRQIIGYRDVLAKNAKGWGEQLSSQRRGHSRYPLDALPAAERESAREIREHSDALVEGISETAHAQLRAFDVSISKLRATRSRTYALSKLEKLAESFQAALLREAIDRVAEFIKDKTDHNSLLARAAIACAMDTTPRAVDFQGEVHKILQAQDQPDLGDRVVAAMWPESVYRPVELDQLIADARKVRFAKNESSKAVAQRVVATALGLKPHERKLRR